MNKTSQAKHITSVWRWVESPTAGGIIQMNSSVLGYLGLIVVLAACSTSAPATGTLQVNITGLPAGTNANVVVTKPDSTTQTFTASGSISNTPVGSYAITVNDVTNAGFTFKGTVTPSPVTVTEGATASVTVSHQTTASPLAVNITGLPPGVAANVEVSGPDGFKQTVTQASSVLEGLKSGLYSFTVNPVKPDAATFSDDSSPKSLNFVAAAGGSVELKYTCSLVKAPDAALDFLLRASTGKANSTTSYTCADLEKLTRLDTSPSQPSDITNLEGLQYATGLTQLNLGEISKITEVPLRIFDKLTKLTVLNLDRNQISSLPTGVFDKLTNLTTLNLSRNQIASLPAGMFDKLANLTSLKLAGNTLSELSTSLINKLPNLVSLDISSNCFATVQEPLKTILSTATGTITKTNNPKVGCPQKTVSIVDIVSNVLTTKHKSFAGENVYLKTRIDGVAQADGDPIFTTPANVININQTLFVNSELHVELFTQEIGGDIKIGEATLSIDNPYTTGQKIFPLAENGAGYILTLQKK